MSLSVTATGSDGGLNQTSDLIFTTRTPTLSSPLPTITTTLFVVFPPPPFTQSDGPNITISGSIIPAPTFPFPTPSPPPNTTTASFTTFIIVSTPSPITILSTATFIIPTILPPTQTPASAADSATQASLTRTQILTSSILSGLIILIILLLFLFLYIQKRGSSRDLDSPPLTSLATRTGARYGRHPSGLFSNLLPYTRAQNQDEERDQDQRRETNLSMGPIVSSSSRGPGPLSPGTGTGLYDTSWLNRDRDLNWNQSQSQSKSRSQNQNQNQNQQDLNFTESEQEQGRPVTPLLPQRPIFSEPSSPRSPYGSGYASGSGPNISGKRPQTGLQLETSFRFASLPTILHQPPTPLPPITPTNEKGITSTATSSGRLGPPLEEISGLYEDPFPDPDSDLDLEGADTDIDQGGVGVEMRDFALGSASASASAFGNSGVREEAQRASVSTLGFEYLQVGQGGRDGDGGRERGGMHDTRASSGVFPDEVEVEMEVKNDKEGGVRK